MTIPNPPATMMNKACVIEMDATDAMDLKITQAIKKYMLQMKKVWNKNIPFRFICRMLFNPSQMPLRNDATFWAKGNSKRDFRFSQSKPRTSSIPPAPASALVASGISAPSNNSKKAGILPTIAMVVNAMRMTKSTTRSLITVPNN